MWREIEYLTMKLGAYNLFNAGWLEESATQVLCDTFKGLCHGIVHWVAGGNDQIDNMARWDVVMKDYPAGNGFKNVIYFM